MTERKWWMLGAALLVVLLILSDMSRRESKKLSETQAEAIASASLKESVLKTELSEMSRKLKESEGASKDFEETVGADGSRHTKSSERTWKEREEELTSKHQLQLASYRQALSVTKQVIRKLQLEVQKPPALKRWGLWAEYSFIDASISDVGAGFHQSLGPLELGVYALNPPAAKLEPKLALNVRF